MLEFCSPEIFLRIFLEQKKHRISGAKNLVSYINICYSFICGNQNSRRLPSIIRMHVRDLQGGD